MSQYARLLFCSTPSYITPHPSPGSFPTAIYTSPIISFSIVLDVYMFTGAPPPIVSSSLHAARRHLSSNHTDFGKSPSLAFYSLPWIGALLSFYFVSRHFSFQSFCMFQCVCRRKTHSAAFAPSVLGTPCFRPTAILRLLRFDLPACITEHRRMRHIQCRNTSLIVLWHI